MSEPREVVERSTCICYRCITFLALTPPPAPGAVAPESFFFFSVAASNKTVHMCIIDPSTRIPRTLSYMYITITKLVAVIHSPRVHTHYLSVSLWIEGSYNIASTL